MRKRRKYAVHLTDDQCNALKTLLSKGRHAARQLKHAQILLLSDHQQEGTAIAAMVGVVPQTVYNVCQRFVQDGLNAALQERARPGAPPKLDAKGEACAIAIACSDAPAGRKHWTMQMIADKLVELRYVDSISDETVRVRLKKTR